MKETLCWSCQVPGTGGCTWDRSLQPVDGWEATPTILYIGCHCDKKMQDSFLVKKCPLYRKVNLNGRDMGTKATSLPDVLLAAYIDAGMSTREIADLCGLTDGTVQQKIYKLLKKGKKGDEPCQD